MQAVTSQTGTRLTDLIFRVLHNLAISPSSQITFNAVMVYWQHNLKSEGIQFYLENLAQV